MKKRPSRVGALIRHLMSRRPISAMTSKSSPSRLTHDSDALAQNLDQYLKRVVSTTHIPAIAASIVIGGKSFSATAGVSNVKSERSLDKSALFEPFGLTKVLVSGVACELASAGKVDIDRPIVSYLKELDNLTIGRNVSLAHIMSHTSGFLRPNPANFDIVVQYSWSEYLKFLRSSPPLFDPGTVLNVSDADTVILGEVIKRVTGTDPLVLADEIYFHPQAIPTIRASPATTGYSFSLSQGQFEVVDPFRPCEFWRAALLGPRMTIEELARISEAILSSQGKDSECIPPRPASPLFQTVRLPDVLYGPASPHFPVSFGLGFGKYLPNVYGAVGMGSGHCIGIRVCCNPRFVVAVAINTNLPSVLNEAIDGIVVGFTDVERRLRPSRIECEFSPAELQGTYYSAQSHSINVTFDNDLLTIKQGYNPWIPAEVSERWTSTLRAVGNNLLTRVDGLGGSTFGILRHPGTGDPCLFSGMSAYAKDGQSLS